MNQCLLRHLIMRVHVMSEVGNLVQKRREPSRLIFLRAKSQRPAR
jgi:hypothetical protein